MPFTPKLHSGRSYSFSHFAELKSEINTGEINIESLPLERLYQLLIPVWTTLGDMRRLVSMAACKCNIVESSKFVGSYVNIVLDFYGNLFTDCTLQVTTNSIFPANH